MIFKLTPTSSIRWLMYIKEKDRWVQMGYPSCKTDIATLIAYYERKKR